MALYIYIYIELQCGLSLFPYRIAAVVTVSQQDPVDKGHV